MFVVAPATSFHLPHHQQDPSLISPDPNLVFSGDPAGNRRGPAIQFWQQNNNQGSYFNKPAVSINFDHHHQNDSVNVGDGGAISTATCQDCGNQAKKDCSHRRCRTCCRSRGIDCTTHVRSTWVPAARRRERQTMVAGSGGGASSGSTSGAKKPRLIASQTTTSHTSNSNNTPPRSYETSSSHQEAGFKETLPRQVRAPAVFKCVRVTAVEDGEDEYAYQAVVRIGGHVFKGFLYDQGIESGEGFPNLSELHLGGGGNGRNGELNPPEGEVYGGSGGGFLGGGTSYAQVNYPSLGRRRHI